MNEERMAALVAKLQKEANGHYRPRWRDLLTGYAAALEALYGQPEIHALDCATIRHPINTTMLYPPCDCWQRRRQEALAPVGPLADELLGKVET